jgi:hypothetical protein
MKTRLLTTALLATALAGQLRAADEPEADKKPTSKESALRAQMVEDARKQAATAKPKPAPASAAPVTKVNAAAKPAPASATAPAPTGPVAPAASTSAEALAAPSDTDKVASAATATPAATPENPNAKLGETPSVLPKVEVKRGKPTELGRMMFEQEKAIEREKQNTKSTELDKALNGDKVSLPIFGGQTKASRESIASERVSLMEAERDLIEEIAHANTKAQKDKLTQELNELKKIRRDLEQSIR